MPTLQHTPKSSMISDIEYDDVEKLLRVKFAKGGWYEYQDVSKKTYDEFINAESAGKYFLANIKDKYVTERLL